MLENVSFAYSPDKKVLEDVSFRIQPGEMVAIVGQSGGGKTTLFYLLTRLYRPTAGRILVDGINLNDVKIESWWRHLSFMSQDSPIFTGTVRENIAFGSPEPDNLAMYENAMDLAAARDFINDLPEGLDSRIGEGSRVLSGGERQRIALARAFYAQPNVVLFDEATSQLDALTEMRVKKGIEELRRKRRTIVVIAHRLATIQDADRIIVLDGGRIAASGKFAELIARNSLFADMVEGQAISR